MRRFNVFSGELVLSLWCRQKQSWKSSKFFISFRLGQDGRESRASGSNALTFPICLRICKRHTRKKQREGRRTIVFSKLQNEEEDWLTTLDENSIKDRLHTRRSVTDFRIIQISFFRMQHMDRKTWSAIHSGNEWQVRPWCYYTVFHHTANFKNCNIYYTSLPYMQALFMHLYFGFSLKEVTL